MDVEHEELPLAGLKAIEFSHMVMGPSLGLMLADLGVEVTRIEPPGGDPTRSLRGSGAGYFPMYNRNKASVCLDLKQSQGVTLARRLVRQADIVLENFRPGTLERLGLGYAVLSHDNPGLVYCSAKGFLSGPFAERTALDEVAQMMGGLAYMTGPPGKPMRAGASVVDVAGGMFGVIGILAALHRRARTGQGAQVQCALYETTAFLVGQHMAQMAVTGTAAAPMPARVSAWGIYDVFDTAAGGQVFVAVVSDSQWRSFCTEFDLPELRDDPGLAANNDRVAARPRVLPQMRALLAGIPLDSILTRLQAIGVPAARIARPEDLFDETHLNAGGLVDVRLPDGRAVRLPGLPIELDGRRFGVRRHPPAAGANTDEVLRGLGVDEAEMLALRTAGVIPRVTA